MDSTTNPRRARLFQVALLIETDTSWGRNVIRGVASFADRFGPWDLVVDSISQGQRWTLPESWQGDGIIARISNPLQLDHIRKFRVPVVNVEDVYQEQPGIGMVWSDVRARALMALEHLRERGCSQFAYFAPPSYEYSGRLEQHFAAAVSAAGFPCDSYRPGYRMGRNIGREEQQRRVCRWLDHLPRPVAILAVDAKRGQQLTEICRSAGIHVPDEVAILAGETDEFFCELSAPPLSSIRLACHRIGYEAATMLASMMQGHSAPEQPVEIAPIEVAPRHSTSMLAVEDPLIVSAMRFIQTHAYQGIVVEDILRSIPVSKRYLEKAFTRHFGHAPGHEIRRLRLERGRHLLTNSELSVDEIADACGYAGATQFGAAFRKRFGKSPLQYRKQFSGS